jgi:hypothetical protein
MTDQIFAFRSPSNRLVTDTPHRAADLAIARRVGRGLRLDPYLDPYGSCLMCLMRLMRLLDALGVRG